MDVLLMLDNQITLALYDWGVGYPLLQRLFLYIAVVAVYALPIVLLWLFWRNRGRDRRSAIKIFLAVVLVWRLLSHTLGVFFYDLYGFRDRPFTERGLQEFFFEQPEKAFPSDHAAVLTVVTALLFFYGYRKLAWLFAGALVLTGFGRIVVGFHYFGDITGGVALGLVMWGVMKVLDQPIERFFDRITLLEKRSDSES